MPDQLIEFWNEKVDPIYVIQNEYQLRRAVRTYTGDAQIHVGMLVRARIAFWDEYERAARAGERMQPVELYRGVCRAQQYYQLLESIPPLLPWIICPLASYLYERKELAFLAQERMLEVLAETPVKPDGKVDSRLAKVQFEIYRELQDRVHGPVIQKIQSEQKNLNVNVDASSGSQIGQQAIGLITDVGELDRRIADVKARREALQNVPQPAQVIDQQKLMRPDMVDAELVQK
jgi:hypothetical protein